MILRQGSPPANRTQVFLIIAPLRINNFFCDLNGLVFRIFQNERPHRIVSIALGIIFPIVSAQAGCSLFCCRCDKFADQIDDGNAEIP